MVIKKNNLLVLLLLALLIASCSSGGVKQSQLLRDLIDKSQYLEAIKYVENEPFYQQENQKLLGLMELGLLHHHSGNYSKSIEVLAKAQEVVQKQFTVSIKGKIQKQILNENLDKFYGESYEISMLYYFQALNHYLIYKKSNTRQELFKARAQVMAWDGYLSTLRRKKSGSVYYKGDIAAKVLAGLIHEDIGGARESQISLQLYKDAEKLLVKSYGAYKTFNKDSPNYIKNFEKFPKLGASRVDSKYIKKTNYYNDLNEFLDFKILMLTKKYRSRSFNKVAKQISASKESKSKARKYNSLRSKVSFVLHKGLIPKKVPKLEYYGLGKSIREGSAVAAIGATVVSLFAAETLGLLPPPSTYSPIGAHLGLNVALAATEHAAISFELPVIKEYRVEGRTRVEVYKEGVKVDEALISLVNPLGDIASLAIAEKSSGLYGRIGARLVTKYLSAILASYGTYKLVKSQTESRFFGKQAAVLQYLGLSKAIAGSEKADTRYWTSLPGEIRIGDIYLNPGKYQFRLVIDSGNDSRIVNLGEKEIKKGDNILFNKTIRKSE